MLYTLSFKKAFGLSTIPSDYSLFLLEIANAECNFSIGDRKITVKIGRFGISEQEKTIISYFRHSDERDLRYINEVPTLDVTFDVDLTIPETSRDEGPRNMKIDSLVEPFVHDAFSATSRFIEAYRTVKYGIKRGSVGWSRGEFPLMPEMTESEFRTYLFYQLQNLEGTFVGCISGSRIISTSSTDHALIAQQIQQVVQDEIPLSSKLIVRGWECFFQEDYRNCVIYAATVLELMITMSLRRSFISKSVATKSQIDKFLDNVSNRLLCTIVLGHMGIGDNRLRERIAHIFDIRNGLIHGKRKTSSRSEAETVLNDTEELLELLRRELGDDGLE